jgi:hypothetical protein
MARIRAVESMARWRLPRRLTTWRRIVAPDGTWWPARAPGGRPSSIRGVRAASADDWPTGSAPRAEYLIAALTVARARLGGIQRLGRGAAAQTFATYAPNRY